MRLVWLSTWWIIFSSVVLGSSVLNIGLMSEPRDLDPQLCSGSNETKIALNLFEGLVAKDTKTLNIVPAVSDSWKVSKDGKKVTFQKIGRAHV